MARPPKLGIDYFPLDVDIFSDEKMVPISVEFGIKGEIIVIRLLCAIYRNGYFIEWSELLRYKLAKDMPTISADLLDSVVRRLVKWGFFSRDLFEKHNILTSAGIQRRYFSAVRKRTRRSAASLPFILVDVIEKAAPNSAPQPQPRPVPPAPAPHAAKPQPSNADWLKDFFADKNSESLALLCKNLSLGPGKIDLLRELALAVVAEWDLSGISHSDYSDWSRHLISSMRIKSRNFRNLNSVDNSSPAPLPPQNYSFAGFGGQDV